MEEREKIRGVEVEEETVLKREEEREEMATDRLGIGTEGRY